MTMLLRKDEMLVLNVEVPYKKQWKAMAKATKLGMNVMMDHNTDFMILNAM